MMGASTNPNSARLAALQERKQAIEGSLTKRNEELRQLCIQEAELTGSMPPEIPLKPGESPPVFRRCVGTSYQLSENLINLLYNDDESMNSLEVNMQIQANLAEAALGLANDSSISKTIRRQLMVEYQHHKRQHSILEEKLSLLKSHTQMSPPNSVPPIPQQPKQKKKPRPVTQGDSISLNVNMQQHEPFEHLTLRHSMRSLQHPLTGDISGCRDGSYPKPSYRNSDTAMYRNDDALGSGIYRLSLNGYNTYMERKENGHIIGNGHFQHHYVHSQHHPNFYQQHLSYVQMASETLPHSTQRFQHSRQSYVMYNSNINTQPVHEYAKCSTSPKNMMKLSNSPGSHSQTSGYSKSPSIGSGSFLSHSRQYPYIDQQFRSPNPHQIQPHQRYEHDMMSTGLGGYWKKMESGELIWCNSAASESWQYDKRFGSLDRRRNRLHKRTSPQVDPKCATISVMLPYPELVRPTQSKPQQIPNRNRQDMRQLVRTQSLGSVGAQTVDSMWPSDDNSSCGSDAHSINDVSANRKQKQKEWFETSLDGPSRSHPTRPHSTVSSVISVALPISPEEKYVETILPPKLLLEIPAESNPNTSLTVHEPNMELFNNNIPRNGTLIQAGQCKPYHEETKPFEMSDFYKYSTKFKKSGNIESPRLSSPSFYKQQSPIKTDNNQVVLQKGIYQPLQSQKCQPFVSNGNFEVSAENMGNPDIISSPHLTQVPTNIAENFSLEMNAWYQNQGNDNNNCSSTATLV